ncbi:MAG: sigma 54-interacting transcriptional regulator [Acidobacteriota bacterium]
MSPGGSAADSDSSTLAGEPTRDRIAPAPRPTLTILAHPEVERVGEVAVLDELAEGAMVELSRRAPGFARRGWGSRRGLEDRHLSRRPVRLVAGAGAGEVRLLAAPASRLEVDGKPVGDDPVVLDSARLDSGVVLLLARQVTLLLHRSTPVPVGSLPKFGMVGASDPMVALRRAIERAAKLDVPVLLRGETGTGKELVAHALHEHGPRGRSGFVSVNLGAIAPSLAAAELFGAARGAYTGADQARRGIFEHADGGTLFLDEVGEAPAEVRAALLRVLETGEIQPVGERRTRRVDVRLITATDRDLEHAVEAGDWGRALFHRLAAWEIHLPPLRARRDDLGQLLHELIRREARRIGRSGDAARHPLTDAPLLAALARHDWPGNVRELANVARELALAWVDGHVANGAVDAAALGPQTQRLAALWPESGRSGAATETAAESRRRRPSKIPHDELVAVLEAHEFRFKDAAAALGISRTSLYQLVEAAPDLHTVADLDDATIDAARARLGDDAERLAKALRVSPEAMRRRLAESRK